MSIWGKVIGGIAGFALGGPLGGLLGAVAGHSVDRMKEAEASLITDDCKYDDLDQNSRQVVFTAAVIALSAKMAKTDGRVTKDEIAAFKQVFHIPSHESASVARIWNEAKFEPSGYEPYANQIAQLFSGEQVVLEEILGALFHIAKADGLIHPAELELLRNIAIIFGFSSNAFERLKYIHIGEKVIDDPYRVLNIDHEASDEAVKAAYRKLIRENHPDKLMAQGVPQEFVDLANAKMATINAAYDRIEKQRGLK
ncbi:MAG: molecular chaperone DjlA [Magnetovibrio sp.]|nr:molecular chaperone DjlA [Magnetovibrio sp.]|tara:strand:- start:743 stop:1504 length:762 start_codon:yes stop_codon:yes gene_type:complete